MIYFSVVCSDFYHGYFDILRYRGCCQEFHRRIDRHDAGFTGIGVNRPVVHAPRLDQLLGMRFGIDAYNDGRGWVLASGFQCRKSAVRPGIINAGYHIDIRKSLQSIFHGRLPKIGRPAFITTDDIGIGCFLLETFLDIVSPDDHVRQVWIIQDGDLCFTAQSGADSFGSQLTSRAA